MGIFVLFLIISEAELQREGKPSFTNSPLIVTVARAGAGEPGARSLGLLHGCQGTQQATVSKAQPPGLQPRLMWVLVAQVAA